MVAVAAVASVLFAASTMNEYTGCELLTSEEVRSCGELLAVTIRDGTQAPLCCDYSYTHNLAAYDRNNFVYITTNRFSGDEISGICESIVVYAPLNAAWCRQRYLPDYLEDDE